MITGHRRRPTTTATATTPTVRSSTTKVANGFATSIVLDKPAGTIDGDWLIASVTIMQNIVVNPPSGWQQLVPRLGPTSDGSRYLQVWAKKASGEPSTWTFTPASAHWMAGSVVCIRDADPSNPFDDVKSTLGAPATAVTLPAVTPGHPNSLLVAIASITEISDGSERVNTPTGMVELAEVTTSGNGVFNECDLAVYSQAIASAGSTGTRVGPMSGGHTMGFCAVSVAVKGSVGSSPSTTAPGAPQTAGATPAAASAVVSWQPPTSDGGSAITGYTVTASPGGATASVGGSTLVATVTGLTNGTAYTFAVVATNSVGTGPASVPTPPTTPAASIPSTGAAHKTKFALCIRNRSWYADYPGPHYFTGMKYILGRDLPMIEVNLPDGGDITLANDAAEFDAWKQFPGWTRRKWNGNSGPAADVQGWAIQRRIVAVPLAFWPAGYTLADIARGANDAHYFALAQRLHDDGWGNSYIRLGWEAGGNWYPWTWTGGRAADFRAAHRHVGTIFKTVDRAFQIGFCSGAPDILQGTFTFTGRDGASQSLFFNGEYPASFAGSNPADHSIPWVPSWNTVWPGDQYVDYVEIDHYDKSWAFAGTARAPDGSWGNPQAVWDRDHWVRLELVKRFCQEHNKPIAIGEWGIGDRTGSGSSEWGGDNPAFLYQMCDWLDNFPAPGVAYHSYFWSDEQDGRHSLASEGSDNPDTPNPTTAKSYAAFKALFAGAS